MDNRVVHHTGATVFTGVQTGLSSQLSSMAGEGDPPNSAWCGSPFSARIGSRRSDSKRLPLLQLRV